MPEAAPRRRLNPEVRYWIDISGKQKTLLARAAGFPNYISFYLALRDDTVRASPLMTARLERVAELVGLSRDEIFLDEGRR